MTWTDDMRAVLREVADSGGSFGDAAKRLGVTRSAVAGEAHRSGVRFRGWRVKLDYAAAASIRASRGMWSARELADEWGVSPGEIYSIWSGRHWRET